MQRSSNEPTALPRLGRYELLVRIGKGGMASVYLARARGDAGFARLYAIKVLHPHLAQEPDLVHMLLDEARIAARLHHPNVVSTVDVGRDESGRTYIVLDYVDGPALDRLLRRMPDARPPSMIVPIVIDALRGLHAAHELRDEHGRSLELVHRDVTPGNLLVGVDGVARITDFGVAKARARTTKTREGIVKGKAGYIAPEVLIGGAIDRRADLFSMGVLLWNSLTGETLFGTDDLASTLRALLEREVPAPSTVGLMPNPIFDAPILMALARDPKHRYESALEMAAALADSLTLAGGPEPPEEIGAWVERTFGEQLETRRRAARTPGEPAWDPEQIEPPSTSAMVRKDPTGRVVSAMPSPVIEDPSEPRSDDTATEDRPPRRWPWIVLTALVLAAAIAIAAAYTMSARPEEAPAPSAAHPRPALAPEPEPARPPPSRAVDLDRDLRRRDEGP